MRIGNLSRARASAEPRGRASFLVLSFILAASVLLAGWLALPSADQSRTPATTNVASAPPEAARPVPAPDKPKAASAPVQASVAPPSRVQVADAGAAVSYLSPTPFIPVVPDKAAEAAMPAEPVQNASEPARPPVAAPVATKPAPPALKVAEPTVVASVTQASSATQASPAEPRKAADDLLDLNTASVDELNALQGAGRIGRAIVRGRPYGSVEDLVKKRVLSRSVFARVKDQVTTR
jgi:DNA uptake protein ComE-like DNA-binding protein